MKFRIILIITVFVTGYSSLAFPMTGQEAMTKVIAKMDSVETIKAKLTISYQFGEVYTGLFMYMKPGKMYISFTNPAGKLIITDGKKLWVYDASTEVCGVQELEMEDPEEAEESVDKKKNEIVPKLTGGLSRLTKGYEATYVDDSSNPSIELFNDKFKYSNIKLDFDSDYMLTGAVFTDIDGDGFSIKLQDIKIGENIVPGMFNFKAPANAQVVKNPLDVR